MFLKMPFYRRIWPFISGNLNLIELKRFKMMKMCVSEMLSFGFRKRGPFLKSVKPTAMANWLSEEPRSLLRAMSMTVCDLSAITKPWPIEKRVADLVSSEFFEQGDMERQELNIMPIVSEFSYDQITEEHP